MALQFPELSARRPRGERTAQPSGKVGKVTSFCGTCWSRGWAGYRTTPGQHFAGPRDLWRSNHGGIMTSPWYRQIFPTRLAPHRQAVQEFITTRQGYRLATSTGGVLTGRGADLTLIDDPLKPEEALSEARRNATNDWYANTLYSRLNDKRRGAIVIIMQRLHEDDLVGHVLGQEPWEVVCFPAIAEADEVHEIDTIWGPQCFTRRPGEASPRGREPLAPLAHIRRTIGEYNFAGQYQQSPAPLGGGLVKTEWFKHYAEKERPESFERIVQSWDTANKATELSDFSVCTTWGVRGKKLCLLGLLRQRLEYPALKRAGRATMMPGCLLNTRVRDWHLQIWGGNYRR